MTIKLVALTVLTMFAFAGNSVLCRIALKGTEIDAYSFTFIRLASGALMLQFITFILAKTSSSKSEVCSNKANWISAAMLFIYAAGFSLAYIDLSVATGALLLFGSIQLTMIGCSVCSGEQLGGKKLLGLTFALSGLLGMLLPGVSAPSLSGSVLMIAAGIGWGVYSLRGQKVSAPIQVTANNFVRATLFALILSLVFISKMHLDIEGVFYATFSGAIASGLSYSIWYSILPSLKATNAATIQLSVPVIAAFGGVAIGEPLSIRFILATIFILGGIALVVSSKSKWK